MREVYSCNRRFTRPFPRHYRHPDPPYLSHDPLPPDSLEGAQRAEDPPVPLPQLHPLPAQALQADVVAPPVHADSAHFSPPHEEGHHCHTDVARRLAMDVRQLQPAPVSLSPPPKCLTLGEACGREGHPGYSPRHQLA